MKPKRDLMTSYNFKLPLVRPLQANKEATVNEAISAIDSLLFRGIVCVAQLLPDSPAEGDLVLLEMVEEEKLKLELALYTNNIWHKFEPKSGWVIYCVSMRNFLYFDGVGYSKILPEISNE